MAAKKPSPKRAAGSQKSPTAARFRAVQAKPKAVARAKPGKPKPTIPVHALGDDRIHLALAQPGRLRQGYLKTLCGLQAVSALSPFALADVKRKRCRVCFGKVDEEGRFAG
jgi:hypothetical protein